MKANDKPLVAADIMSKATVSTRPDQSLRDAERLLIEHRISGMPVIEDNQLVGVLSRSDLPRLEVLMRSLDELVSDRQNWDEQADGFKHTAQPEFHGFRERLEKLTVRDAMRDQVVTCGLNTPVPEIAAELVRHHIHRVIVVDAGRPVGVVSSIDIVKLVAERGVAAAYRLPGNGPAKT